MRRAVFLPAAGAEDDQRIIRCPYCLSKRGEGTNIVHVVKDNEFETVLYELGNLADKFSDQPMSNVYRHIKHIEALVAELKDDGGERDATRT